jgi:predicted RecA/RadA family phage recombinase
MSQYVDTPTKTFEADAAIAKHARVKLDTDGKITTAGLADKDIGTAVDEAFAAGDIIAVRLRTATGTCKMIAIEAMDAGATVYTESDGKVQDTAQATAFQVGTAMEAATADGDIIEVLRNTHGDTAAV